MLKAQLEVVITSYVQYVERTTGCRHYQLNAAYAESTIRSRHYPLSAATNAQLQLVITR